KSELCVVYSGNGGRLRTCSVRRVGMPRAARLFKYGQCALKERPRLRIVALVPKQVREVVGGLGRVGMLRPSASSRAARASRNSARLGSKLRARGNLTLAATRFHYALRDRAGRATFLNSPVGA